MTEPNVTVPEDLRVGKMGRFYVCRDNPNDYYWVCSDRPDGTRFVWTKARKLELALMLCEELHQADTEEVS